MRDLEFTHTIYPLSLGLGMTFVLESLNVFDKIPTKSGIYLLGIIVMWLSWLLVYMVFLRRKDEKKKKI